MSNSTSSAPHTATPSISDVLFKGINGSLPLGLYAAPVFIWVMLFIFFGVNPKAIARQATADSVSNTLQEDINLISEKVDNDDFLKMSKDDIIQSNKDEHFLLEKARRKIEKSKASQSFGSNDGDTIAFDTDLNPIISQDTTSTDSTEIDITDLNYEMNQLKEDRQRKYQQKRAEIQQREKERKAKIDQAIADNQRKQAAKEQQTYEEFQLEKAAYEQSVTQFHQHAANGHVQAYPRHQPRKKEAKSDFSFHTATGLKDDLNRYDKPTIKTAETAPTAAPKRQKASDDIIQQIPLYATIDQAQKVRSGQKIQLRITQDGIYQGLFIPANAIIYGICNLRNNRLNITVPSIHYESEVIRTNMIAYDTVGIQGIYVDGKFNALSKDIINEGLRTGSRLGFASNQNPLSGLTLNLGRKANNQVSVHVPTGYPVLLYHGQVSKSNKQYNTETYGY